MKNNEIDGKVEDALDAFSHLEDITPTGDWNEAVMRRIASASGGEKTFYRKPKYVLVLAVIILINLGFYLNIYYDTKQKTDYRRLELKSISGDFLINPASLNN
jgi:hypothetical protein